jgi:hypothetical protein
MLRCGDPANSARESRTWKRFHVTNARSRATYEVSKHTELVGSVVNCGDFIVTSTPTAMTRSAAAVVGGTGTRRTPSPSRRSRGVLAHIALWACVWAGGCTLTHADFEPVLVDSDRLTTDAGPQRPAPDPPVACAPGALCCDGGACGGGNGCTGGDCDPPVLTPPLPVPSDDGGVGCSGEDCPVAPIPLAPTCDDGARNGDEAGVDCGGGCPQPCLAGATCTVGGDCNSGVCGGNGRCAQPTCGDGVRNQGETSIDCGGNCPQNCPVGGGCSADADCQSGVCGAAACAPGVASCCQPPRCDDGVANGGESSVDCGTTACGLCPIDATCAVDAQCATGFCQGGRCQDPGTCIDRIQNGRETSIDCGGGTCGRCPDRSRCTQPSDCSNNNCDEGGVCISCGDNFLDGTETGVDCGGADPFCRRCNPGEQCRINSDCTTNFCFNGFC